MKKTFSITVLMVLLTCFTACDDASQNQIANLKTVSERINDLHKTRATIKDMEDDAALMKEDKYLIEYEYPIGEDESYVITYRLKNDKCYEIKIDTYLNKESHTKKVQKEIMADMANNTNFGKTSFKDDIYHWDNSDNSVMVELNTHNIERGTINLLIRSQP